MTRETARTAARPQFGAVHGAGIELPDGDAQPLSARDPDDGKSDASGQDRRR